MTFGGFLAQKRKEKGWTQKELAEKLFVSESSVCKWERDRAMPDISLLTRLSELLGVTEHELLTASADDDARRKERDAKKWKRLSFGWNLFFLIAYGVSVAVCFPVDLATSGGLSWFFTVLCALLLSACFTTLPRYLPFRAATVPGAAFLALCALFLSCGAIPGGWFWLATAPTFVAAVAVFLPISLSRYFHGTFPARHAALLSVLLDGALLVGMLALLDGETGGNWFVPLALPLSLGGWALALGTVACLRYLPISRLSRAGITVMGYAGAFVGFGYAAEVLLRNAGIEAEGGSFAPFAANFSVWDRETVGPNVTLLIFLAATVTGAALLAAGIARAVRKKKNG